jgi:hypothetical protein
MLRTKPHSNSGSLRLLKKLSRVSLALLAVSILIGALLNLMVSIGITTVSPEGGIHGPGIWVLKFVSVACLAGYALLSVFVMGYATVHAGEEEFVDTRRAMFWTWILPFMSAVFFFALSNQGPDGEV